LIEKNAIGEVAKIIKEGIIISANGFISRNLHGMADSNSNFYMIGSMGLASSIGLGVSLKNPKKKIFIFDGDGNILMNLGSLTTIGTLQPKNLVHIIFDNSKHASTGGQPTNSKFIRIENIAKECGYKFVFRVETKERLKNIIKKVKTLTGPTMILLKIKSGGKIGDRIEISPIEIKKRFMKKLQEK
jgi:sulfopyruvate decarboxylase subunit beta